MGGKELLISKFKIISFLLYIITIFSIDDGYFLQYNYLKYFCIAVIAVYLFVNFKIFMTGKNLLLNCAILSFCLFTIISSYMNRGETTRDPFLAAIVFMATFAEAFFVFEIAAEENRIGELINQYYWLTLFCTIIVDVAAVFLPGLKSAYGNYICGTKFSVAYLHVILIALYMSKEWLKRERIGKRNVVLIVLSVWTIWMSSYVECNTGMIGALILVALFLAPENIKAWLCSFKTMIVFALLPVLFFFFYEMILLNSTVQNLVVNVFSRELTLTGRTIIYEKLPIVFANHFWTGYGYGTTYEVTMRYIGYADTQNCWTEWMMMAGMVGVVLLALVLILSFRKCGRIEYGDGFPIVAIICIYFVMGCVEITMGISFFALVAILNGIGIEQELRLETEGYNAGEV